jgi:hypothetical protein
VSRVMQGVLGGCGLCLNWARDTPTTPLPKNPNRQAACSVILDDSRRPIVCKDRDAGQRGNGMDGID